MNIRIVKKSSSWQVFLSKSTIDTEDKMHMPNLNAYLEYYSYDNRTQMYNKITKVGRFKGNFL